MPYEEVYASGGRRAMRLASRALAATAFVSVWVAVAVLAASAAIAVGAKSAEVVTEGRVVEVPSGRWRLTVEPSGEPSRPVARVVGEGGEVKAESAPGQDISMELDGPHTLRVELDASEGSVAKAAVTLAPAGLSGAIAGVSWDDAAKAATIELAPEEGQEVKWQLVGVRDGDEGESAVALAEGTAAEACRLRVAAALPAGAREGVWRLYASVKSEGSGVLSVPVAVTNLARAAS